MNLGQVARMMAGFAAFFTAAQLPPLLLALHEGTGGRFVAAGGFLASIAVGVLVVALLWWAGRNTHGPVFRKEAIATAGLSWLLAGLLGAIPFQWSGLLTNPVDAVFEAISGLTTTGASVLGSGGKPAIEDTPASLLLWRALMQWIGGCGIVLVFVALLPAMGVTGKNLLTSESVAVGTETYQPRAIEKARLIAAIYGALTVACAVLLVAVGGFGWFEAICHAFTALSTGGFSTRSSIASFQSLGGEIVLIVFMFLGGCSLAWVAVHWRSGRHCLPGLVRSGEFRLYALVTAVGIVVCTALLVLSGVAAPTALRHAAFNVTSVLTSTGYANADYQAWPAGALLLLFGMMLVGGCSGSTAGGIKQVRLLVILRLLAYSIRHFVRPKSVERIKLDDEVLPAAVISSILAIVLLWAVTLGLGALLLGLDEQLPFIGALTASASMLGSTGPSLTLVDPVAAEAVLGTIMAAPVQSGVANIGPMGGYGDLRDGTKLVMAALMLLGRLELLTVLALFSPSFWRR